MQMRSNNFLGDDQPQTEQKNVTNVINSKQAPNIYQNITNNNQINNYIINDPNAVAGLLKGTATTATVEKKPA